MKTQSRYNGRLPGEYYHEADPNAHAALVVGPCVTKDSNGVRMPSDSTTIRRAFAVRASKVAWQIATASLYNCTNLCNRWPPLVIPECSFSKSTQSIAIIFPRLCVPKEARWCILGIDSSLRRFRLASVARQERQGQCCAIQCCWRW
jgi:hypothetical protein